MDGAKAKLTDVNPHLVCVLCHGYFVDATTIAECLHSFCRSCIFRHLERKPICPICEVAVHNTKLHRSLRPDKTLQDIVYKLVPGLYRNEMQRRREFYKQHPFRDEYLEPECRGVGLDRVIYSPDDPFSLSLEFYDEDREREEWNNNNVILKPVPIKKPPPGSKRYLQCPASFKVKHLKKFIRQKCGLAENCEVEVIYRKEPLPDSYSLMDIAYIYTWKRNEPMRFYYKLPDVPMKTIEAAKALASGKIVGDPIQSNDEATQPTRADPVKADPIKNTGEDSVNSNGITIKILGPVKDKENVEAKPTAHINLTKPTEHNNAKIKLTISELHQLTESRIANSPSELNVIPLTSGDTSDGALVVDIKNDDQTKVNAVPAVTLHKSDPIDAPTISIPEVDAGRSLTGPVVHPISSPIQTGEPSDPVAPRTMTKQDELPVSVLLSLGSCAPEIKSTPAVVNKMSTTTPKPILPKVAENKPPSILDQLLSRKMMKANSKVNQIAAELAESKTGIKNSFKTPAPFSSNPLALKTTSNSKVFDPAAGSRTPYPHSHNSPQHIPVYPPPMMPSLNKPAPWRDTSKDNDRFSLFPHSPRHVPHYSSYSIDLKQNGKQFDNKPPNPDPFLFTPNECTPLNNGNQNGVSGPKKTSRPTFDKPQTTPQDITNGHANGNADRSEVTLTTSNGSLTISTQQLTDSNVSSNSETTTPQVVQKNLSGHRINGNRHLLSGPPSRKRTGIENKPQLTSDNSSSLPETPLSTGGGKSISLSRKTQGQVPGGVVSKTGPTLDQRLQQLYKSNSRPQSNGHASAEKSQQLPAPKHPSRLASWLKTRFSVNSKVANTKPKMPKKEKPVETAADKLGKEMNMLKKKLDELKKNAEVCEITQENPTAEATLARDVTPNVSIEFMKAADMAKIDNSNGKTKDRGVKRPVPGLKSIQDLDVKKIKLSPEEEETKKPKLDKKGDEALDLSGSTKSMEELTQRIALIQKNGTLNNQQQFNWLLNRPIITGQQFAPRPT